MTNEVQAVDFNSLVFASNEDIKTDSLKVAEAFSKNHKDVLRVIDRIISQASDLFNQRNFAPVEYLDAKGESRRMYELTKDGFIMVVMSFTGEKAMQVKEAYINAFNFMREQLMKPYALKELPPATPKTLTPAMQRQVQNRVNALAKSQVGTTHQMLYGQIKEKFDVPRYSEVPYHRYLELCTMLDMKPLEGELEPLEEMIYVKKSEWLARQQQITGIEFKSGVVPVDTVVAVCNETKFSNIAIIPKKPLQELKAVLDQINFENIEL